MLLSPRPAGILVVALTAIAVLELSNSRLAFAQGATSLTFARPAAQGPGTPGYVVISDPTIHPLFPDGFPSSLAYPFLIDLQGNGRPDVVSCHTTNPAHPPVKVPCRVLRPQPDGSVLEVTRQLFGQGTLPSVIWPREIVSGDFNRDGRQDIFVADSGYDVAPYGGATNLLLVSNADGTYTDRSATLPQTPDYTHAASVADINGDGYLDIYVGNTGGSPVGPYFLMGLGDGTFTQKTTGLPPAIQNLQQKFLSALLFDVDQDGHPDLVLGSQPANGYVGNIVLFNDGFGNDFTTRPQYVLPPGPLDSGSATEDIVSLDINRDGLLDLMLMWSSGVSDNGFGVQVLINHGNGALVDETSTRLPDTVFRMTGPWYAFIHLSDFNGDGWEDFYFGTIQHEDGSIHPRMWLNNGNGTWRTVATSALPSEFGYGSILAVDFEGDGRTDILRLGGNPTGGPPDISYNTFLNRTVFPPTIGSLPNGRTRVNTAIAVTVAIGAGAGGTAGLTVSAGSSNPALVPNANLVFSGSGASRTLTITPASNRVGATTIVVSVSQGGLLTSTSFVLEVRSAQQSGDFDGDGKADIAVYRRSNGTWYILPSTPNTAAVSYAFGVSTDAPVPADYDGDGKIDIAVYRPASGIWYIVLSATWTLRTTGWGVSTDIPVPRDYDGDGKTDIAVYRPSTGTWWILLSANSSAISYQWGVSTDVPVPADYDGDGKTDIAIYRPSTGTWYVLPSIPNTAVASYQWGVSTDTPVPGDYDGDGKADVAIYRPSTGTWYLLPSIPNRPAISYAWGISTDVPVPADYDSDGKTDIAVYRPSNGTWWVLLSATSSTISYQWGVSTDVPLLKRP